MGGGDFPGIDRIIFAQWISAAQIIEAVGGGEVGRAIGGEFECGEAVGEIYLHAGGIGVRGGGVGGSALGIYVGEEPAAWEGCIIGDRLFEEYVGDRFATESIGAGEVSGGGFDWAIGGGSCGVDCVCGDGIFAGAIDRGLWGGVGFIGGVGHGDYSAGRIEHYGGDSVGGGGIWEGGE